MTEPAILTNSLILYKKRPARVIAGGERLEIELDDKNRVKVRPKDVALLHPGPVGDLQALADAAAMQDEVVPTWEIILDAGAAVDLPTLAELAFGAYTPAAAWAAWQWVEDGIYFQGTPEQITARPAEAAQRDQAARQARRSEAMQRSDFLQRAARKQVSPLQDSRYLQEIIDLALARRADSRLVRELGRNERPENAHALLLEWGVWDEWVNPHPRRLALPLETPLMTLPDLLDEPRLDLTHLGAYAVDDRGNQDPDDALSLVECRVDAGGNFAGSRLWVHVADAAAAVTPDSPADLEARARAATLYLPEGAVQMLPPQAITRLGLGLQPVSPALSFLLTLDADAQLSEVEIHPTLVRVQRMTYEEVESIIDEQPFAGLRRISQAFQTARRRNGAFMIDLPEAGIRVGEGRVVIEPLPRLQSRDMVREAMLMAGAAVAQFTLRHGIPTPYVIQEAPGAEQAAPRMDDSTSLAARFAMRRRLRRSRISSAPGLHAGVGIEPYCRATSPLRRYLDLVVHQQLRLWLRGLPVIGEQALFERLGGSDQQTAAINTAESLSRRHWTLVYLLQHPQWRGEGVVVESHERRGIVLIPELTFETPLYLRDDMPLDSRVELMVREINLPELEVSFSIL